MRVVWISVGLLAVFLVTLLVFYEPAPVQDELATSGDNLIENPFADESGNHPEPEKNIDLAVLPAGQSSADTSSKPESRSQSDIQPVSMAGHESVTATPEQPASKDLNSDSASGDVGVGDAGGNTAILTEAVTTLPESDQADEKKPGLAMIMLEKERNKNKLAVIVHESNTQKLTEEEIKALYLDRLTRWQDGSKVMLYDLPLGDRYRDKFSKAILKMTALEADKQELKRRELQIKANDVQVKAKNVVVSYVERDPNAVAYVPLSLIREKSNVKVVFTIP